MKDAIRALNRVAKWRTMYAGWQLGTRLKGDPECDAVRDAAEARILLRVEVSALARLLVDAGVFTEEQWNDQLAVEADALNAMLAKKWPGVTATDFGLTFTAEAAESMKGWRP